MDSKVLLITVINALLSAHPFPNKFFQVVLKPCSVTFRFLKLSDKFLCFHFKSIIILLQCIYSTPQASFSNHQPFYRRKEDTELVAGLMVGTGYEFCSES